MNLTSVDRLHSSRTKVDRAKKHFQELEGVILAFLDSHPYEIGTSYDPDTGKLTHYVTKANPTPPVISAICGDILVNLMGALDHLAYNLVDAAGTSTSGRKIYFPIAESAQGLVGTKGRCIHGITNAASQAIDAVQPYKGGNHVLWQIKQLNNIDKHRALTTVGCTIDAFDILPVLAEMARQRFHWIEDITITKGGMWGILGKPLGPLNEGEEIWASIWKTEPQYDLKLRFDVAFNEPQIAEGDQVLDLLRQAIDLVDNLLTSFAPLL